MGSPVDTSIAGRAHLAGAGRQDGGYGRVRSVRTACWSIRPFRFSQGGGQRPDWSGINPSLADPTPSRWFDTSQFSSPPPYTFGNAGRTFSGSRADTTRELDVSLSKRFGITEKFQALLRADCFNLTNTPHFDPPNVSLGNPLFGVVSSQGNQARIIQFALKLIY